MNPDALPPPEMAKKAEILVVVAGAELFTGNNLIVMAGFEHSVANMFFVPFALLVKSDTAFVAAHKAPDLSHVTWGHFLASNLVPVTIGNVIGGALMVGAVYWFVYLRNSSTVQRAWPSPKAR